METQMAKWCDNSPIYTLVCVECGDWSGCDGNAADDITRTARCRIDGAEGYATDSKSMYVESRVGLRDVEAETLCVL